MKLTEAKR